MKPEICRDSFGDSSCFWKRWQNDACIFVGRSFHENSA